MLARTSSTLQKPKGQMNYANNQYPLNATSSFTSSSISVYSDMENSVDCVILHSNSPDREFGTKSDSINQILCNILFTRVFRPLLFLKEITAHRDIFQR